MKKLIAVLNTARQPLTSEETKGICLVLLRPLSEEQHFRLLVEGYERFGELANHLVVQPFSEHQIQLVLNRVMPLPEDEARHPRTH